MRKKIAYLIIAVTMLLSFSITSYADDEPEFQNPVEALSLTDESSDVITEKLKDVQQYSISPSNIMAKTLDDCYAACDYGTEEYKVVNVTGFPVVLCTNPEGATISDINGTCDITAPSGDMNCTMSYNVQISIKDLYIDSCAHGTYTYSEICNSDRTETVNNNSLSGAIDSTWEIEEGVLKLYITAGKVTVVYDVNGISFDKYTIDIPERATEEAETETKTGLPGVIEKVKNGFSDIPEKVNNMISGNNDGNTGTISSNKKVISILAASLLVVLVIIYCLFTGKRHNKKSMTKAKTRRSRLEKSFDETPVRRKKHKSEDDLDLDKYIDDEDDDMDEIDDEDDIPRTKKDQNIHLTHEMVEDFDTATAKETKKTAAQKNAPVVQLIPFEDAMKDAKPSKPSQKPAAQPAVKTPVSRPNVQNPAVQKTSVNPATPANTARPVQGMNRPNVQNNMPVHNRPVNSTVQQPVRPQAQNRPNNVQRPQMPVNPAMNMQNQQSQQNKQPIQNNPPMQKRPQPQQAPQIQNRNAINTVPRPQNVQQPNMRQPMNHGTNPQMQRTPAQNGINPNRPMQRPNQPLPQPGYRQQMNPQMNQRPVQNMNQNPQMRQMQPQRPMPQTSAKQPVNPNYQRQVSAPQQNVRTLEMQKIQQNTRRPEPAPKPLNY